MEERLWTDPKEAALTLGEAVRTAPFQILLDMLEQYERRVLAEGLEDETVTKDYLRGFVHAVRALRQDMMAARQTADQNDAKEEWASKQKRMREVHTGAPGHGPGGLS